MTKPLILTEALKTALIARFTALADDEITLSHRVAEWTGHAPLLEEDIALANIAQDELGHGTLWMGLRTALDGSNADALAYHRDAAEYRNAPLTELPKGDWAFTMVRQYLFDAWEVLWLDTARQSRYTPLADAAGQALREEKFHLQHTALWVERLALGTPESTRRMQAALNQLWAYALALFDPLPAEADAVAVGLLPDVAALQTRWLELVRGHLEGVGLNIPSASPLPYSRHHHTEHLPPLLADFQRVARAFPDSQVW
ncbi:phenylacetate-CoA oxygenase subunit PaaI [Deinococcus ruber]|uniref:Phenylacetate-CoA oxygenase subunit PaaI n=2 Tax=Deinococcus ruber TaxID=1848197 RepID=A0A918CK08_9DEIO|nr:phenylacetate-CoA oxygenase subunit PaaI [Deinococcus ruber]